MNDKWHVCVYECACVRARACMCVHACVCLNGVFSLLQWEKGVDNKWFRVGRWGMDLTV